MLSSIVLEIIRNKIRNEQKFILVESGNEHEALHLLTHQFSIDFRLKISFSFPSS